MDSTPDSDSTRALGKSTADKILAHYGIPGMKWGRRRTRQQIDASDDHKSAAEVKDKVKKAKTTAVVSNKELQTAINRMNLEIQYSRLNEQTKPKSAGKKFINKMFEDKRFREARIDSLVKATQPVRDINALGRSLEDVRL